MTAAPRAWWTVPPGAMLAAAAAVAWLALATDPLRDGLDLLRIADRSSFPSRAGAIATAALAPLLPWAFVAGAAHLATPPPSPASRLRALGLLLSSAVLPPLALVGPLVLALALLAPHPAAAGLLGVAGAAALLGAGALVGHGLALRVLGARRGPRAVRGLRLLEAAVAVGTVALLLASGPAAFVAPGGGATLWRAACASGLPGVPPASWLGDAVAAASAGAPAGPGPWLLALVFLAACAGSGVRARPSASGAEVVRVGRGEGWAAPFLELSCWALAAHAAATLPGGDRPDAALPVVVLALLTAVPNAARAAAPGPGERLLMAPRSPLRRGSARRAFVRCLRAAAPRAGASGLLLGLAGAWGRIPADAAAVGWVAAAVSAWCAAMLAQPAWRARVEGLDVAPGGAAPEPEPSQGAWERLLAQATVALLLLVAAAAGPSVVLADPAYRAAWYALVALAAAGALFFAGLLPLWLVGLDGARDDRPFRLS